MRKPAALASRLFSDCGSPRASGEAVLPRSRDEILSRRRAGLEPTDDSPPVVTIQVLLRFFFFFFFSFRRRSQPLHHDDAPLLDDVCRPPPPPPGDSFHRPRESCSPVRLAPGLPFVLYLIDWRRSVFRYCEVVRPRSVPRLAPRPPMAPFHRPPEGEFTAEGHPLTGQISNEDRMTLRWTKRISYFQDVPLQERKEHSYLL